MRVNTDKNKENALKIWHVFPPGQPPSRVNSFRLATSWSASPGVLERLQLQLRDTALGSPVASPVWPESSLEKREKTAQTPRLPGAITFPSELRFVQNLYHWKLDIWGFPTVFCMTHFVYQKDSKIALENRVRKLCGARIRHVADKDELQYHAGWWHTVRYSNAWNLRNPSIKCTPPPLNTGFEVLGHFWVP